MAGPQDGYFCFSAQYYWFRVRYLVIFRLPPGDIPVKFRSNTIISIKNVFYWSLWVDRSKIDNENPHSLLALPKPNKSIEMSLMMVVSWFSISKSSEDRRARYDQTRELACNCWYSWSPKEYWCFGDLTFSLVPSSDQEISEFSKQVPMQFTDVVYVA